MGFIIKVLVTAVAAYIAARLLPGVTIADVKTTLIVALVLALLNAILRPVLVALTIPITVLTLGLFLLIINAIIVKLADWLIDGFTVNGWITAIIFSLVVTIVSFVLNLLIPDRD
jgi:putative membrane protein